MTMMVMLLLLLLLMMMMMMMLFEAENFAIGTLVQAVVARTRWETQSACLRIQTSRLG